MKTNMGDAVDASSGGHVAPSRVRKSAITHSLAIGLRRLHLLWRLFFRVVIIIVLLKTAALVQYGEAGYLDVLGKYQISGTTHRIVVSIMKLDPLTRKLALMVWDIRDKLSDGKMIAGLR